MTLLNSIDKFRRQHFWAAVAIVLLIGCAIGGGFFYSFRIQDSNVPSGEWVLAQFGSTSETIVLNAQLEPGAVMSLVAPFEGRILRRMVQTGDMVTKNAVLMEISADSLITDQRDSEAAAIRTHQALDAARQWSTSTEVLSAKRSLTQTEASILVSRRRLGETAALYEKGIVSGLELEAAKNDLQGAQAQHQNAVESLAATLEKGNAMHVRLLGLEYLNRQVKQNEIEEKLKQSIVRAPMDGVILAQAAVSSFDGSSAKEPEVGVTVNAKSTLLTIGDVSTFAIRASLDELDIQRVKPGMPVKVHVSINDSIVLNGSLARVSSQARKSGGFGGESSARAATFDIQAAVSDIPDAMRRQLRIGMSVRLEIFPEAMVKGLLIPLSSVITNADGIPHVKRKLKNGEIQIVKIRAGKTLLDQLEVLEGLNLNDAVWRPLSSKIDDVDALSAHGLVAPSELQ